IARGCLVTELPPVERPHAHTFPRRNRLVSGLAAATVVVEAAAGSGALITADAALDQGRAVLAVPGPITSPTSVGCNKLIQQGAKPALCAGDILEELGLGGLTPGQCPGAPGERIPPEDLSPLQRTLWDALAAESCHIDALAGSAKAPTADVLTALTELAALRTSSGWADPGAAPRGSWETIYFGGGTPSLLPPEAIRTLLLNAVPSTSSLHDVEVTLEANPEDVTPKSATAWRHAGVNRISLGAQSFDDRVLRWMHRP